MQNFKHKKFIEAMQKKRLERKKIKDYFESDAGKGLLEKVHKLKESDVDPSILPF